MKRATMQVTLVCCLMAIWPIVTMAGEESSDKAHMAAAYELLETMQYDKTFTETVEQAVDVQVKKNPAVAPYRKTMLDFMSKYMSWNSLKDDVAQIYVDEFTTQELKEITAFYKTPVGKKGALLIPQLANKGRELGMKRVQDHMPEFQLMLAEESKKIAEEYVSNKTDKPSVPVPDAIKTFFATMDTMATKMDVKGLMTGFATNATLTMKKLTPQGPRERTMTRDMMEQMLAKNYATTKSYSITRTFVSVATNTTDGTITVEDVETEAAVIQGGTSINKSHNTFVLVPADGSYLILKQIAQLQDTKKVPDQQ